MESAWEKLAKKVVKYISKEYDDDVSLDDVLDWFMGCDEDDLTSQNVATLADWFMETHQEKIK